MNTIEKKNLVMALIDARHAAMNTRNLLDSRFVENNLSEKEMVALQKCAEFLTALEGRFDELYDENEAWKV